MFGVMLVKTEIVADCNEEVLLHSLAAAMGGRGFSLLGVVALHEADGALATFGDPEVTQSPEFAGILRCLADQIDVTADRPANLVIPSA